MQRKILVTASIIGFTGIILGAFGAHGLKEVLTQTEIDSYKTGVQYQMYHALFLLLLGVFSEKHATMYIKVVFYLTLSGVILFSGSIYLLSLKQVLNLGSFSKVLGPITPVGGLLLILSWFIFMMYVIKNLKK